MFPHSARQLLAVLAAILAPATPRLQGVPQLHFGAPESVEPENLGTTIEAVVPAACATRFGLVQFYLHTTSEHRINDENFSLEVSGTRV